MRISIAQINSTIADFEGNSKKILACAQRAHDEQKADMVLFPELAVCGFPPMDLMEDGSFAELNARTLKDLEKELPRDIAVGLGFIKENPYSQGKNYVNVYGVILDRKLVFEQIKTLIPASDIFDEARYFEPAREWNVFEYSGERIGFGISEDVWRGIGGPGVSYSKDPVGILSELNITMLCVPSASPFTTRGYRVRHVLAEQIVIRENIPLVYANAAGANDEVIFSGRSFVVSPYKKAGKTKDCFLAACAGAFTEDLVVWDSIADQKNKTLPGMENTTALEENDPYKAGLSRYELDMLEKALTEGIRNYMKKCGFTRVHLGLSGGIDSALVAYLAVKAAGPENVVCINMPSCFSSQGSKDDSKELAGNLGCRYEVIPIDSIYNPAISALDDVFKKLPFDAAEENIQARIRGILLMAYSNKFKSMLLAGGNKSEIAMGYCTLYGDTNGALAPIGDVLKTEVIALCKLINLHSVNNSGKAIIPQAIIDKPPSAELRPNQKDEDSLPPYSVLDQILKLHLYGKLSPGEIAKRGFDRELVNGIIRTVIRNEFKRRQLPPVLKVTPRTFGIGRRMPLTRVIYEI